ncbi:MAG: L-threonylcarbamoyladenylate synthase [Candidatus Saccharimonadales bacterium]
MKNLSSRAQAAPLLLAGQIGVIASDTVYGVVACADNQAAVARLYTLKHRYGKPGTIIAAHIEQLVDLGIPRRYMVPVEGYWPNPISVVVPTGPNLDYLHLGKGSLAVRVPADDDLRALLEQTGPLLTSSANHPGEPTATTIDMAQDYFEGNVDFYADGGDLYGNASSTIIRVVDDAIEVLREGAVAINETGEVS